MIFYKPHVYLQIKESNKEASVSEGIDALKNLLG